MQKWKRLKLEQQEQCRQGVLDMRDENRNVVLRNRDQYIAYWLERGSWDPKLGRNKNAEELGRGFDKAFNLKQRIAFSPDPPKRTRAQKWDMFSQGVLTAGAFSSNPNIARDNIVALGLRAQRQANEAAQAQALQNLQAPLIAAQAAQTARDEQDARDARLAAMIAKATADEFEKRGLNPPTGS